MATRFETTGFGLLMTAAAGGLDAYSYLGHGGVFAGLQTGNLILLGVSLGQGQWAHAGRDLLALAAFAAGTALVRLSQRRAAHPDRAGRRQAILLGVAAVVALVGACGAWVGDRWAVSGLAIAAAALLQEFRQLNDAPFTPLMMTGNLRTLTASAVDGWVGRDSAAWRRARRTAGLMLSFGSGAAAVAALIGPVGAGALTVPVVALILAAACRSPRAAKGGRA